MKVYIIGAGAAGLLLANILRQYDPIVLEEKPSLPANHGAVLRFRSDVIGELTGIKFKKVEVQKAAVFERRLHTRSDLRLQNIYSQKVTGAIAPRSILNLDDCTRYIAPDDLIPRLASGVDVRFNDSLHIETIKRLHGDGAVIISTVPMPSLMQIVEWEDTPIFPSKTIACFSAKLSSCDVHQTIYHCDPCDPVYRSSIVGNKFIAEAIGLNLMLPHDDMIAILENYFGVYNPRFMDLVDLKIQTFGKIQPIDDNVRRGFIYSMTEKYNLYSFGRYATWRPLLLDDLVKDALIVEQLFTQRKQCANRMLAINRG